MKKYFLLFAAFFTLLSCDRKNVYISGKLTNATPLSRISLINVADISTLPIASLQVNKDGSFSDTVQIEKNGIYALVYNGNFNFVYLKRGQNIHINGDAMVFPSEMNLTGDGAGNNLFLFAVRNFNQSYLSKLDRNLISQNPDTFLENIKKIKSDLDDEIKKEQKKYEPDVSVSVWQTNSNNLILMSFIQQYLNKEKMEHQNDPNFKLPKKLNEYKNSLVRFQKYMVANFPNYRSFLLDEYGQDIKKYMEEHSKEETSVTEKLAGYLNTKKDWTQETKDYLLAFVFSKYDMQPENPRIDTILNQLNKDIHTPKVKEGIRQLGKVVLGPKTGEDAPIYSLKKENGKEMSFKDLKGKPTFVMFYSSFNPYIVNGAIPTVKMIVDKYKGKANFLFLNLDDTFAQFRKSAGEIFKGIPAINAYCPKGINSKMAKDYGLYDFKLPCFLVIDKDGKIMTKTVMNPEEPSFVKAIDTVIK